MQDISLRLTLHDVDGQDSEALGRDLQQALLEQPEVQAVDPLPLPPEPGQKGTPVDWGTLLLTLTASGGVLVTLIASIKDWLPPRQQATVTITLDGDSITLGRGPYSPAQQALIDQFLARHRGFVLPND